jgi:hypothetical protein
MFLSLDCDRNCFFTIDKMEMKEMKYDVMEMRCIVCMQVLSPGEQHVCLGSAERRVALANSPFGSQRGHRGLKGMDVMIEEVGQDARKNYDKLRAVFRESGRKTAKILSEVLENNQKKK